MDTLITIYCPEMQHKKITLPPGVSLHQIDYDHNYDQESMIKDLDGDEIEWSLTLERDIFKQYHIKNHHNRYDIYKCYSSHKNELNVILRAYLYDFCEVENEQEYLGFIKQTESPQKG